VNAHRFDHALVVGGSGMLAGCCRKLLTISDTVSVMARREDRIRAISSDIVPIIADYANEQTAEAALENKSFDLVVAWVHGRRPFFRRALARHVTDGGRFAQILGSAHADPSHPDRLDSMKACAEGLPVTYQAIVLGFVMDGAMARWLSDREISDGVFDAIQSRAPLTIVGTVEPWSARP
jgi:hypothetical protein